MPFVSEPPAQTKFFIMDTRTTGANVLWWRAARCGYTNDLNAAGVYDEAEARTIERIRGTDVAVPVDVARACAMTMVDTARLRGELEARDAEAAAARRRWG